MAKSAIVRKSCLYCSLLFCSLVLISLSSAHSATLSEPAPLLPVYNDMARVKDAWKYDEVLARTWQGTRRRLVEAYQIPFVHRPKSEQPGDAVSEGVGYGMMVALYSNDQAGFNKIWAAAESYMWTGAFYNWRVAEDGKVIGTGAASDAEQDIACMLIFATKLVDKGVWQAYTSPKGATYAKRAQEMIESIWTLMVANGKFLDPGAGWSKGAFVNPGYFAPAFYRIFAAYQPGKHDWTGLIDQCYKTLAASPGYAMGLVPDWMTPDGNYTGDKLGYNTYADGKTMYKDAIRVQWRLATDWLWFKEPRAKTFLDKATAFIGQASKADFFQMDGSTVLDTFTLGNGKSRTRKEHSHLTVGMWAPAALVSGTPEVALGFSRELLGFHDPKADYWGNAVASNGEDTLHNEMYFDQFLAWFGAATISGVFANIYENLDKAGFQGHPAWQTPPALVPLTTNGAAAGYVIAGTYNTQVNWALVISDAQGNARRVFTGAGTSMKAEWNGMDESGVALSPGSYSMHIISRGMPVDTLVLPVQVQIHKPLKRIPLTGRNPGASTFITSDGRQVAPGILPQSPNNILWNLDLQ